MGDNSLRRSLESDADTLRSQIRDEADKRAQRKLLQKLRLIERQLEGIPEETPRTEEERAAIKADIYAQVQRQKANWKLREETATNPNDPYKRIREMEREREKFEKERKRLVEKQAPGAGANSSKRIKVELEYMLRNYRPSNDGKIETLIDKWRRSGDPSYDPSVKVRFRNVRKKKSQSDFAL